MATKTNNLKLSKAENSDAILSTLENNNKNFDKLDEVIMRLRRNQLSGEVSGTEIVVQDSAEMESVLHLSGNSEQDSRSGKNKLSKLALTTKTTVGGVTFTPVFDDNNDLLYVNVNGTATEQITQLISSFVPNLNVEYKINGCPANGSTTTAHVYVTGGTTIVSGADKSATWTTEGTKGYHIIVANGATITNMKFYPMIRLATVTDNTYEPYGLKPSPDFESPIINVKGKSDNLFDSDYSLVTKGGFVKQSDGSYYLSAVNQVSNIWENTEGYKGQFTISLDCKWENNNNGRGEVIRINYTDGTSTDFMTDAGVANKKWGSFVRTTEKNKVVQSLSTTWGNSRQNYFRNVMLNKGAEVLPYQPYGYVPAEAKAEGKNLAQEVYVQSSTTVTDGVCTQTHTDTKVDLEWKIVGKLNNEGATQLAFKAYNDLGVKNLSFVKKSTFNQIIFGLNGSVRDNLVYIKTDDLIDGETYTLQWNILNNIQGSVSWNNIQIEKGTKATSYEPYKLTTVSLPLGDIELCSTPDGTRDTFERVDGVWNKKNNVGNTIVNGLNGQKPNTSEYYSTENHNAFTISYVYPKWIKAACNGYSDKFKVITTANDINGKDEPNLYFGSISSSQIFVKVAKEIAPTLEDFKTLLLNNPIEIQYPLAEPTYTPITDQALISALDELEELILHKGYNKITVTAVNGVKAYLDLTYYKDINLVLNNLTAQIASVGGAS